MLTINLGGKESHSIGLDRDVLAIELPHDPNRIPENLVLGVRYNDLEKFKDIQFPVEVESIIDSEPGSKRFYSMDKNNILEQTGLGGQTAWGVVALPEGDFTSLMDIIVEGLEKVKSNVEEMKKTK